MINKVELRNFESTKKYCEEVAEKAAKEKEASCLYGFLATNIVRGLTGKPYNEMTDKNFFKTKRNIDVCKDLPQFYSLPKEEYEVMVYHFEELGKIKNYCEELMTDCNGNDDDWEFNVNCNYDNIKHYLALLSSRVAR